MKLKTKKEKILDIAKKTLLMEANELRLVAEKINESLVKCMEVILDSKGKIVLIGIGKSGNIAKKITATLCSTGTPAVFLHASDAVHGDLGIYNPGDPTIMISKNGSTEELIRLIPILKNFNSPIISIVGNLKSPLAKKSDIVLDVTISQEADALGIVPTSSTTAMIAMGDALSNVLMIEKGFTKQQFSSLHPGGQLGRNLLLLVKDIMHKEIPKVEILTKLRDIVIKLTSNPLGAVCVLNKSMELLGLITEGDIRRSLQSFKNIDKIIAKNIMTKSPICIKQTATINDAMKLMEDRPNQLSVLPVINKDNKCIGLIRIHDIFQTKLY